MLIFVTKVFKYLILSHHHQQGINNIRKNHQMKEMASLRLRNQVQSLENSINVQTALCLYIVPDVSALCHDLVTIRRIVASGRFLLIVSKTGRSSDLLTT